jgi:hypothetical protein
MQRFRALPALLPDSLGQTQVVRDSSDRNTSYMGIDIIPGKGGGTNTLFHMRGMIGMDKDGLIGHCTFPGVRKSIQD